MPQISDMKCLKHLSSSDDSTLDFWVSKYTLTALWMNKPESRMISYSLICKIGLQRTTAQHRLPWHTDRIFRFMITRFAGRWTDITDHRDPEWLSTRKENLHSSMMVAWLLLKNNNNKKKTKTQKQTTCNPFSICRFATESPGLHSSRYKQPYRYPFKCTSCEGLRDLLSKSKKKCAALWSMSLVSTLMRLPMPANLKIKMAK